MRTEAETRYYEEGFKAGRIGELANPYFAEALWKATAWTQGNKDGQRVAAENEAYCRANEFRL